jgi:hypothetical protein
MSFAQMEGRCYCCGKGGHKSPQCRHKDRPKDEWVINKAQQAEQSHAQAASSTSTESEESSQSGNSDSDDPSVGWAGTHVDLQFYQASTLRNWILLDNQSSATIFCNKDYVTNIRKTKATLELHTNGGVLMTNHKCDIPGFGEAWFNPDAITNIFSLAEMADKYTITYDSKNDDAFVVQMPKKPVRFERHGNKLYFHKPSGTDAKAPDHIEAQFINTLEENKAFYTRKSEKSARLVPLTRYAISARYAGDSSDEFDKRQSYNFRGYQIGRKDFRSGHWYNQRQNYSPQTNSDCRRLDRNSARAHSSSEKGDASH